MDFPVLRALSLYNIFVYVGIVEGGVLMLRMKNFKFCRKGGTANEFLLKENVICGSFDKFFLRIN